MCRTKRHLLFIIHKVCMFLSKRTFLDSIDVKVFPPPFMISDISHKTQNLFLLRFPFTKTLVITSVSLAFQSPHCRKITCRKQKPDNVAHPLSKISYPEAGTPQYRIVEKHRSVKCFCHYVGLFQLLHRAVFIRSDD